LNLMGLASTRMHPMPGQYLQAHRVAARLYAAIDAFRKSGANSANPWNAWLSAFKHNK